MLFFPKNEYLFVYFFNDQDDPVVLDDIIIYQRDAEGNVLSGCYDVNFSGEICVSPKENRGIVAITPFPGIALIEINAIRVSYSNGECRYLSQKELMKYVSIEIPPVPDCDKYIIPVQNDMYINDNLKKKEIKQTRIGNVVNRFIRWYVKNC